MKLYTWQPGNKNAWKAQIAAEYVGAKVECPPFVFGTDNKTPEFLKKNPFGKVPTLDTPQGCVFESNAIARHVARLKDTGLFGGSVFETAKIDQWIEFFTWEVDLQIYAWVLPLLHYGPYDKQKEEAAKDALKKPLKVVEDLLQTQTFLVGDRITLADVIATCNLYLGFWKVFGKEWRAEHPNITRYFLTCVNQPEFKKVIGEVSLPDTPLQYTAPKESKPAATPKAAEPKKPAEAKPAADVEAASAAEEKDAKAKVQAWLDSQPSTPMVLDAWKRLYSNSPASKFREVAINGLWNGGKVPNSPNDEEFTGFDPAGFTWWFCSFKYVEENTVNFMVMNKVGGFLQRIDYARRYAFGVMCILKKGDVFPIEGVWMFRGSEIPPQLVDECYDLDLYSWTKVDLKDAAQKKRLEDMLCEEATIDGLENIDCKVFK